MESRRQPKALKSTPSPTPRRPRRTQAVTTGGGAALSEPSRQAANTDAVSSAEALAVQALAALAQVMRLRVFRALVGAGPDGLTPSALSEALAVPASTLSFHLKELVRAGLITQQRDGRHLIYRPALANMQALLDYLSAHCCQGACSVSPDTSLPRTDSGCC